MKIVIAYRQSDALRGYLPCIVKALKKEDHEVQQVTFAQGVEEHEVRKHLMANMKLISATIYFSDRICAVGKMKEAISIDWLEQLPLKTTELQIIEKFKASANRPL